jgi:steroid 5-alpha reductase family enzyme
MSPKTIAFCWCGIAYAAAIAAAVAAGYAVRDQFHPLVVVAIADAVGTAVIFAFSLAFNNSSFYDPYWSIAPMVMVAYWSMDAGNTARAIVVAALVWAWGGRLTANFLAGWPNVRHEDWRYVNLRQQNGRAYWLVSFFGIHFAPTAWVYLGCLAFFPAFTSARAFGAADVFAAAFTAGAIALEAIADRQLWQFRKSNPANGPIMKSGLWKHSRHPNYLGEILFWWGLFLCGLAADSAIWWTVLGPISITLLFIFISVPMIDKRHCERRPEYSEHKRRTSALLPVGRKLTFDSFFGGSRRG